MSIPNYTPQPGEGRTTPAPRPYTPQATFGPVTAKALSESPERAYQAYRLANGRTARNRSKYAGFKESLFGQALAALLQLETTQNPGVTLDNVNDIIANFSGAVDNGGMYGLLGNSAASAANRIDFASLDDPDAEKFMKLIAGAAGMGQSGVGASSIQSQLADLLYQQENANQLDNLEGDTLLGERFAGSQFAQALAALGFR